MSQFSRHAIAEYLPEIKGICASIEVELSKHDLDRLTELQPLPAIEQYGRSKVVYAMMLVHEWLSGSAFTTHHVYLQKKDKSAKWADMIAILNAKIIEHQNDAPVIVLSISRSGRITRTIDGTALEHEFDSDGFKKDILFMLHEHDGYIPTRDIQKRIGAKSTEVVSKTIAAINTVLHTKLQLPKKQDVIESKRGSGYRLNPLYNVVITN
ncbi:HTH domain-containing protein [Patescibacteria group bacterium]|nr:HTH domain-containing protein [Patescibacteria group bacterium]